MSVTKFRPKKKKRVFAFCKHCNKPITKKQEKVLVTFEIGWWHKECWDSVINHAFRY